MRRLVVWLAVAAASWGSVILLAALLDFVLWRVSRDYIYPPREFLRQGVKGGAFLGTVLAAVATMLRYPLPSRRTVIWGTIGFCCTPLVFAIVAGGYSGLFGHRVSRAQVAEQVLPGRREAFCTALIQGGKFGLSAGFLIATGIMLRERGRPVDVGPKIGPE